MADAPNMSSAASTCAIWNKPEVNVLLIARISGSVGHKRVVMSRLIQWALLTSASDAYCWDCCCELLLSHVALLRAQALIASPDDG